MMFRNFINRRIDQKWSSASQTQNWWTSPRMASYINEKICDDPPFGVLGALNKAIKGKSLSRGISVGFGKGGKERSILKAGLVEKFDAFELSKKRIDISRALSAAEGLEDRMNERLEDAFEATLPESYDLVYWDHSLHHMFDVDRALDWALQILRPGGWLIVNEYIGPNRLQYSRDDVNFSRLFLERNRSKLTDHPRRVRYSNFISRARQIWRDPSEAPQSARIPASFSRRMGVEMKLLGGSAIHLLAPYIIPIEPNGGELTEALIAWDQEGSRRGLNHFGFGIGQRRF